MVELHSCPGMGNASALCTIEDRVGKAERESVDHIVAQISAELQRERIKNAELMERISELETQIRVNQNKALVQDKEGSRRKAPRQRYKESKRQKAGEFDGRTENGLTVGGKSASPVGQDYQCVLPKYESTEHGMVYQMSMEHTRMLGFENLKDGDDSDDFDNVDEANDEDDNYHGEDGVDIHNAEENSRTNNDIIAKKVQVMAVDTPKSNLCLQEIGQVQDMSKLGELENEEVKTEDCKEQVEVHSSGYYACHAGSGSIQQRRSSTKVAFCPKEVRRIVELEALQEKNAQSHTMRKIIVFASLGIKHGCEDMYELDFDHFSILRKGEPFVSLQSPGEHVLYENPGIRRKVFYPNRQNPTLCPVQTLEEEKAMRPSDQSCPSSLFLCIKYGGRTRNLPQNEYVRQRMGKNKLKSFGPLMCKMAMLVHVRSGSFFFKALGITLLFMAGFTDHLIQKETKNRSLGLLQKYYRKDEDAEGEKLFLELTETSDTQAALKLDQSTTKKASTKFKPKRHSHAAHEPSNSERSSGYPQSGATSCAPQFGLVGYNSIHTQAPGADKASSLKPAINNYASNMSYSNPTTCHMFPPHQPANGFIPMMCWPHPGTYAYAPFPSSASYFPVHPRSCYTYPPSRDFFPKTVRGTGKTDAVSGESGDDSGSSSSSS
ncbi:uncharacterized protein LOC115742887 [Rhodamnia argentea]|uniref:Uncharacterized protein LOC115742887 n=1 Tax=Rhodamnia argentea TaxID=178133 RepID=A0A8B8PF11_9MYRT|nr:uncharacterized protein LOC115742887 [Rhodamnia argentea]